MNDEQDDRLQAHWSDHVFGILGLLWIAAVLYILWGVARDLWLEWKEKSKTQPAKIADPGGSPTTISMTDRRS